jgi:lysine-specific metallo-endopeptidase family protein/uncharacterized protein DUF5050
MRARFFLKTRLPIECHIETQPEYQLGKPITVKGTLHNSSAFPIWILSWNTFLNLDWRGLLINHNGSPVPRVAGIHNHGAPKREAYLRISPGGSLSREFDISENYFIIDAGDYQASFQLPILGAVQKGEAEPPFNKYQLNLIESRTATFRIDGDAPPSPIVSADVLNLPAQRTFGDYPPLPKPPKCIGMSSIEAKNWENAHNLAYSHIVAAHKSAQTSLDAIYKQWFETPIFFWWRSGWEIRRKQVVDTYAAMADWMSRSTVTYQAAKDCPFDMVAWTFRGLRQEINLCKIAFDEDYLRFFFRTSAPLARAQIAIHEISHAAGNTQDHWYLYLIVRQLANFDPSLAVSNAENYAYYGMNNDGDLPKKMFPLGSKSKSPPFVTFDGWVWYVGENYAVMKIFWDGTQPANPNPGGATTNSASAPHVTADGWVWFVGGNGAVMKMRTDGTDPANPGGAFSQTRPFVTADEWVWYVGLNYKLMRMRTDGTDNNPVPGPGGDDVLANVFWAPVVTSDGWVWFQGYYDGIMGKMMKMRIDGTQQSNPGLAIAGSAPFVTDDGWVWYQNNAVVVNSNKPNALMKMRTDGTQQSNPGGNLTATSPFVHKDWVYFAGTPEQYLWRMRTDGSAQNVIGESYTKSTPFVVTGNMEFVFFRGTNDALWRGLLDA